MKFRDLTIGQAFTFASDGFVTTRSFYAKCWKISPRKYADGVHEYQVGTINVTVYPVKEMKL